MLYSLPRCYKKFTVFAGLVKYQLRSITHLLAKLLVVRPKVKLRIRSPNNDRHFHDLTQLHTMTYITIACPRKNEPRSTVNNCTKPLSATNQGGGVCKQL